MSWLFNFNIMGLLSFASDVGCSVPTGFYAGFLLHMMILPILLTCVGVAWILARGWLLAASCIAWAMKRKKPKYTPFTVATRCLQTLNFFVFLLYPGLCSKIFRLFKGCTPGSLSIGGVQYLEADLSQVCYEGEHKTYVFYTCVFFIPAYVIGIPFFTWFSLYLSRKEIQSQRHNPILMMKLGQLYRAFESKYWYYEIIGKFAAACRDLFLLLLASP